MDRKLVKRIVKKARKSNFIMADLMKANNRSFSTIERWVLKADKNLINPGSIEILTKGLGVTQTEIFEP